MSGSESHTIRVGRTGTEAVAGGRRRRARLEERAGPLEIQAPPAVKKRSEDLGVLARLPG